MQETRKVTFTNSIKTKLILIMAALVALPLLASILVSVVNTRSEGLDTAVEINNAQAHIVEQSILSVLDQNIQVLQTFAAAPSTIAYLETSDREGLEEDLLRQMRYIDENLADGNSTIITGTDGKQILRTVGDTVDISDREYFQKAISGSVYVSDIEISKSTGKRIASFAVPVWDEAHEKVLGIVQRNYDLSDFHDIIASEVTEEKQEIVIVDRKGSVVAHSGHEISADNPEDQSGNPFYTDSRGTQLEGSYNSPWAGEVWEISWIKEPQTGWVVASCRVQSVALRHVTVMTRMMIVIGIIFLAIGIVVALVMSKSFTEPLKVINDSISDLSQGSFSRIKKFTARKDEFGVIVNDTNAVIERLETIVSDIKASANSVNSSSNDLAETAGQISQTADDVSEAVQEIASGATQQADEIQNATESTGVISKNIQQVTDDATSVARTADEMNNDSKESAKQIEMLKKASDEMSVAIDGISQRIGSTEEAVERISGKVEVINSIASQTNLLALNASIEAARAGDVGRGFAVVAEEIGKLADESSNAANEIRSEMDTLLGEAQNAVAMAKEVNKSNGEQKAILENTVESISKLIRGIETSVAGIESITESARNCDESKNVIVDAMSGLSAISEENAAASEETSASMQELNATVNTLAQAADSLKEISENLMKEMSFFKD